MPLVSDPSVFVADTAIEWISLLTDRARLKALDDIAVLKANSDIFDRNASFDRFKSFLETCR
jgi:polysaccharide biosynthesis protein PslH